MMLKLLLLFVISLAGCVARVCPTLPPARLPLDLENPQPVFMLPVRFTVIQDKNNKVFFCLDGDGYKALATNIEGTKNYLRLQTEIVDKYREYYRLPIDQK